jgi:hypothetical protein
VVRLNHTISINRLTIGCRSVGVAVSWRSVGVAVDGIAVHWIPARWIRRITTGIIAGIMATASNPEAEERPQVYSEPAAGMGRDSGGGEDQNDQ